MIETRPKVMVSGCYDMLHSWHVAFLEEAATYGDLYVFIGSDRTIRQLKNVTAYQSEDERLHMIRALRCVHHAAISRGSGMLDFEAEMRALKPDVFCVNHDGDRQEKAALCAELGTRYVVFADHPGRKLGFPWRSSTLARAHSLMPYRIDLAGGWLDQPMVSVHHSGAVVVVSIEPTEEFNERSGMATSTRGKAVNLWGKRLPCGDRAHLASTLFAFDNPPGTFNVSGSQDAIGIVYPGVTRAMYTGAFWPAAIENDVSAESVEFVEKLVYLVPLTPRNDVYRPTSNHRITADGARRLAEAAERCWSAIKARSAQDFGAALTESFNAQVALFPDMMTEEVRAAIRALSPCPLGYKLSGAGGGGYLVVVADKAPDGAHTIRVRRGDD